MAVSPRPRRTRPAARPTIGAPAHLAHLSERREIGRRLTACRAPAVGAFAPGRRAFDRPPGGRFVDGGFGEPIDSVAVAACSVPVSPRSPAAAPSATQAPTAAPGPRSGLSDPGPAPAPSGAGGRMEDGGPDPPVRGARASSRSAAAPCCSASRSPTSSSAASSTASGRRRRPSSGRRPASTCGPATSSRAAGGEPRGRRPLRGVHAAGAHAARDPAAGGVRPRRAAPVDRHRASRPRGAGRRRWLGGALAGETSVRLRPAGTGAGSSSSCRSPSPARAGWRGSSRPTSTRAVSWRASAGRAGRSGRWPSRPAPCSTPRSTGSCGGPRARSAPSTRRSSSGRRSWPEPTPSSAPSSSNSSPPSASPPSARSRPPSPTASATRWPPSAAAQVALLDAPDGPVRDRLRQVIAETDRLGERMRALLHLGRPVEHAPCRPRSTPRSAVALGSVRPRGAAAGVRVDVERPRRAAEGPPRSRPVRGGAPLSGRNALDAMPGGGASASPPAPADAAGAVELARRGHGPRHAPGARARALRAVLHDEAAAAPASASRWPGSSSRAPGPAWRSRATPAGGTRARHHAPRRGGLSMPPTVLVIEDEPARRGDRDLPAPPGSDGARLRLGRGGPGRARRARAGRRAGRPPPARDGRAGRAGGDPARSGRRRS